jgi:hypothetical protein
MLHHESACGSAPLIVPFRVAVCAGGTLGHPPTTIPDETRVVTTRRLETNQEMPDKRSQAVGEHAAATFMNFGEQGAPVEVSFIS